MFNLIAWIVLGLVAGAIAKLIYPGTQGGGFLGTMILGVIGAFLGGLLHSLIFEHKFELAATNTFSIPSIALAVVGALVAIFLWGLFTRASS